jgi:putative addiction module component (TIGR02574 family)
MRDGGCVSGRRWLECTVWKMWSDNLKGARMSAARNELLSRTLELPRQDHALIVEALISSLDEGAEDTLDDSESEFAALIERRVKEVREGAVELVPWADAVKVIRGEDALHAD